MFYKNSFSFIVPRWLENITDLLLVEGLITFSMFIHKSIIFINSNSEKSSQMLPQLSCLGHLL